MSRQRRDLKRKYRRAIHEQEMAKWRKPINRAEEKGTWRMVWFCGFLVVVWALWDPYIARLFG